MTTKTGDPRSTRAWKSYRAQVYAEETHCCHCGLWVDQSLPKTHPMSRTVDHLDALARGGALLPPRHRARLAHRRCNGRRGHRPDPKPRSLTVSMADI